MRILLEKSDSIKPFFFDNLLRTSAIASLIGLAGIGIAMATVSIQPSASAADDAASAEVKLEFDVKPYLRFSPSSESVDIQLTVSNLANEEFVSNSQNLTLGTNNETGYTLMLTTATDNTALVNSTHTIPSITTTTSSANFDANKWGIKKNDEVDFGPVRGKTYAGDTTISATDEAGPGSASVTVGTKANTTLVSGSYTNTLLYTMVANFVPEPEPTNCQGKPTMQDIATLASQIPNTGNSMQLCDVRDNNLYWVTRLADGNIWMTQNLEYKLIQDTTLTSADSDVTSDWIIPSTTQTAGYDTLGSAAEWPNIDDAHSYYPKEDAHVGTEGDYGNDGDTYGVYDYFVNGTTKAHYESDAACASANSTTEENCAHWRTGIYYNWNAATAGSGTQSVSSGNATSSICPKGWRLPTGGSGGEFQTLLSSVSAANIVQSPYFFLRGGFYLYNYAGVYGYGNNGDYWSSTAYDSDLAYSLDFDSGDVYPTYSDSKQYGFFVRCISR